MAKDPTSSQERAAGAHQRKPLTIDLDAEEVKRADAAAPESATAPDASTAETVLEEPPAAPHAPDAAETRPEETGRQSSLVLPLLAASIVGGAVAALAVVLLASSGMMPFSGKDEQANLSGEIATLRSELDALRQTASDNGLAPMREEIAAMQSAIGDLRQAGETAASDDALQEIQARLAELEKLASEAPANSPADIEPRLSELAAEIQALRNERTNPADTESLAALRQDVANLSERLQSVPSAEQLASIETELGETRRSAEVGTVLAPAVAADALAAALDAGRPFQAELGALETLGADADAVAALRPHAETGLPTLAELQSTFEATVATDDLSPRVPEETGALDRLFSSARGLVEVRPAHPTEGSDPGAVVSRIRGALATGDLPRALAEWQALPETMKASAADWAKAAGARSEGDALVARLRADALSRLARGH